MPEATNCDTYSIEVSNISVETYVKLLAIGAGGEELLAFSKRGVSLQELTLLLQAAGEDAIVEVRNSGKQNTGYTARLSKRDILEVMRLHKAGESHRTIAELFNKNKGTIANLVSEVNRQTGSNWNKVKDVYPPE